MKQLDKVGLGKYNLFGVLAFCFCVNSWKRLSFLRKFGKNAVDVLLTCRLWLVSIRNEGGKRILLLKSMGKFIIISFSICEVLLLLVFILQGDLLFS